MDFLKKVIVSISVAALVIAVAYTLVGDHLPPRTALKVARVVSGLQIPKQAEVVILENQWNFNGDGSAYIVLKISDTAMRQLVIEAEEEGYGPIVFDRLISDEVKAAVDPTTVGVTLMTGDQLNGTVVVLDSTTRRVIVHLYYS